MSRLRSKSLLVAAFALLAAVLLLASVPGAHAQSDGFLQIRKVTGGVSNAPAATTLDLTYTGPAADVAGAKVKENGVEVPLSAPTPLKPDMGIVFVIDSGPNMDQGNLLTRTRDKVKAVIAANPTARYAIVQAGDKAETRVEFTTDVPRLNVAVDQIGPTKASSVWGALSLAGAMYEDRALQPNVVLITADNDAAPAAVGKTAIISNGVALWSVEYTGNGMDPSPYDELIAQTGGRALATGEDVQVPALLDQQMKTITAEQYQVTFNSTFPSGTTITVDLTVGNQTAAVTAVVGGGAIQGKALRPDLGARSQSLPFLDNELALLVAMGLVLVAIAGLAYGFTLMFVKDDLSDMLSPYSDSYAVAEAEEDQGNLGGSALIKRAVALTEQVADQQGVLSRAEASLERANLPLRAGEALFVYLIIVIAATILPLLIWRNLVPAFMFGLLGVLVPPAAVNFIAKRRRKRFMSQLPDTLSLLSGTLRAGYSLMQGVEAVSQEVTEPMGLELRRVITESRLGRPLEESLEASADRMDSPDFAWAVMAIRIQREVGGNLAELLMTVADTMVARERLRRDVAALTAEGRVSAVVLGGLPPMLGVVMYVMNPEYTGALFSETLGYVMVIGAVVSMLVGFLWMRKIINIEI